MSIPTDANLPPTGQRVQLYVAGHDQLWAFGKLVSAELWELDSRELPSHVAVASGLITHWAPEPASPFDGPMLIDAESLVIEAPAPKRIRAEGIAPYAGPPWAPSR